MDRRQASELLRKEMNLHGLQSWSIRLNQNAESHFLGLCSHKDKCIILSAHHIDIHPDPDVVNTIRHEIAHALTPGHAHDDVWAAKAREIGCDNTLPCSNLSLSPDIIDAIRSGATVEVTFDEQVIRTPKYNITRLQERCEVCGKVAKQKSELFVPQAGDTTPDMKFITLECGHLMIKKIPKGTPFHLFQMGGDPNCKHVWDKNNCTLCNRKRPYDFQISGMQFIEAGLAINNGAACFDEMGLGKTIQAGGYIHYHPEKKPVAWIVKSGLKFQTASFIMLWMDEVPQVINTSKDYLLPGIQHYIIGYDMLVSKTRVMKKSGKTVTSGFDITQFDRVGVKTIILDECQQIKNVDSSRTQMVRRLVKGRQVIPLSGTPWNNRGSELFPVLNMMDPVKFWSAEAFSRQWVEKFWHGNILKEGGIRNIKAFKEHTKDLLIRRERTEVMAELPLINRTKLNVVMNKDEAEQYDEAVEEFVQWYEENVENMSGMAIIAAMQKMRHLVALAKIPTTLEYVDEFVEDTDRKLVVFAHHKDVQAILFEELKKKYGSEMPVLQIVAEMNAYARNTAADQFNAAPRALMVASQQAAGEGLNLQTCSDCVMHERQWNPGREEQCEGRFIRIGQTAKSVSAVYAHLEGLTTIDPQIDVIVENKRIRFHDAMNKTEMARWNEDAMMKDLASAIVAAHNAKKNRKVLAS
jgi:hypothetical protein